MNKVKLFFTRFLVVLLALQGLVAAEFLTHEIAQAAFVLPEVAINEVSWAGSSAHASDEWIELYNTTTKDIDLQGWIITGAASGGDLKIPTGTARTIPAKGFYLISHFADSSASSILNVTPDWVTTSLSLNDSCPTSLALNKADATKVDTVGCNGSNWLAGMSGAVKQAQERNLVVTDGLLASSWHSSLGRGNVDPAATPTDFATPKYLNDDTAPVVTEAIVNDGPGVDLDFTATSATLAANWSGFTDPDSTVKGYFFGVGTTTTTADVVPFAASSQLITTTTFTIPSWSENQLLYVLVKAINGVDIESAIRVSDGITLNTLAPNPPSGLAASDTPSDNGGSITVSWNPSTSLDVTNYELSYRQVGVTAWTVVNVGLTTIKVVSNLSNAPVSYQFVLVAIDFNSQRSEEVRPVTAEARDNLAPVINRAQVVLAQNKPGTIDTIRGLASASSESLATVNLLDRDPALPGVVLLGSVPAAVDGSFAMLGFGDNKSAVVWLQLVDAAGNTSKAESFSNDVVAPAAPQLNRLTASCATATCRVNLDWAAGTTDAKTFKVVYTSKGVEKRTMELSSPSVALDLPCGETFDFWVLAYDAAGNESAKSNVFSAVRLTPGVKTIVTLEDGQSRTRTEAIAGSNAARTAAASGTSSFLKPVAKAAEPTSTATAEPTASPTAETDGANSDWVRIFVVVVLLLIVAGSFYALSRTFQDNGSNGSGSTGAAANNQPSEKEKTDQSNQRKNNNRRRRR